MHFFSSCYNYSMWQHTHTQISNGGMSLPIMFTPHKHSTRLPHLIESMGRRYSLTNCAVNGRKLLQNWFSGIDREYVEILIYQAIRNRWSSLLPVGELRAAPSYTRRRNQASPTSQADDQSLGTYIGPALPWAGRRSNGPFKDQCWSMTRMGAGERGGERYT